MQNLNKSTIHITKRISDSGLCSRRDAKALIFAEKVKVNDELITNPAIKVSEEDSINVDGKLLVFSNARPRLWLYHKPAGLITTHKDPKNRQTVFANLPKNMPRVVSVGRLDLDSEGLLLLTDKGDLARYFELPQNKMPRQYKVRVFGDVDMKRLQTLKRGCIIGGIRYSKIEIKFLSSIKSNSWLEVLLYEGKNREIRKVLEHFGLQVSRLIRTQYGPYLLGDLPPGKTKEVVITEEIYENYCRQAKRQED